MTKIKVTICPPAPQDVFFQNHQFDDSLGGSDPITFLNIGTAPRSRELPPSYGRKVKKARLEQAEKALKGHENRDAIMKVLRSDG